jgi:hypothetical protein
MASGEAVQPACMYDASPVLANWSSPIVMGGNYVPTLDNAGNRMLRRLLFIEFNHVVDRKDFISDLEDLIIDTELAAVFLQLLTAYKQLRDAVGKGRLIDACGPDVRKMQVDCAADVDVVAAFIGEGSDYWNIEKVEGAITTVEALRKAFNAHCEIVLKEKHEWKVDEAMFKRLGYEYVRVNICSHCQKLASKEQCGEHYSKKSRQRRFVIKGMRLSKVGTETGPSYGFFSRDSPEPQHVVEPEAVVEPKVVVENKRRYGFRAQDSPEPARAVEPEVVVELPRKRPASESPQPEPQAKRSRIA